MSTARIILRMTGAVGFWLWPFLCGLVWLFRGFKPGGGQGGLSLFQGWLCFLAPTVAFIYYLCVAGMKWSRRLAVVGGGVHVGLLAAIMTLSVFTDGGFVVAPLLLVGPVAWLVYAIRSGEKQNTTNSRSVGPPDTP